MNEHVDIAIVGSGFAGIGAAVRLQQAGIDDFVVLERAGDVGGTWRDNSYPGCACDVPSHLYSFSFAPNPDWTRTYSPQPEIRAYLQRLARDHDLYRSMRLGTTVTSAIQFVPAIQPKVASLHVFQRTAPWVVPHTSRLISRAERRLYRRVPA